MVPQRVFLLGFMASGKSEVGSRLAARLGWRHIDLDEQVERGAGRSVEQIFATEGEAAFRALEAAQSLRVVAEQNVVVSPGGGWVTHPGAFESLPVDTLTVWLRVRPETVLTRLQADPDQPVRPLLQSSDPRRRASELMEAREPLYRRADVSIDTDELTVDDVVDLLEAYVRGGRPIPEQFSRRPPA